MPSAVTAGAPSVLALPDTMISIATGPMVANPPVRPSLRVPVPPELYPKEVKAFYMKEDPENDKVVLGFDMIAPEHYGEIIGASQREEDLDILIKKLKDQGENPKDYDFYLDTRRYGSVPHGGFGMGTERVISWICGLDNIKDAIAFPRTMLRYKP